MQSMENLMKYPERVEVVRENYRNMSARGIDRCFGYPLGTAGRIMRKFGMIRSAEDEESVRRCVLRRTQEMCANRDISAMVRKWKIRRRLDEMRVWESKPQKTKFKIRRITDKSYKAKWYLLKKYGYFADKDSPYTLLYDESTVRVGSSRLSCPESYYEKKYKLKFVQA